MNQFGLATEAELHSGCIWRLNKYSKRRDRCDVRQQVGEGQAAPLCGRRQLLRPSLIFIVGECPALASCPAPVLSRSGRRCGTCNMRFWKSLWRTSSPRLTLQGLPGQQ